MSIRKKFIIYFSLIFIVVGSISIYTIFITLDVNNYLKKELPETIYEIEKSSKLDILAQLIRYNDEVLTQSARNYAFTGDKKWKERYDQFAIKLDLRIKEAIKEGSNKEKEIFSNINDINLKLVDLETKSINLVNDGNLALAQEVLESEEYYNYKNIYNKAIEEYLSLRNYSFDNSALISIEKIELVNKNLLEKTNFLLYLTIFFIILFLFILIFLIFLIIKTFIVPLFIFKNTARKIIAGDLNSKVEISNKDEIGDFANDFNKMTETLKISILNTESKVKERTLDLEKLNNLMTGRELKMIELKKQMSDLMNKLNE